jgi:predicted transcriptional regulator
MCYIIDNTPSRETSMSTTTIRLSDDLKSRVAAAAARAGTTTHNFMLEAVAEKTDLAEQKADFYAEAERRYAKFLETGESIPWEEARRYLLERIAGKDAKRPVARKLDQ